LAQESSYTREELLAYDYYLDALSALVSLRNGYREEGMAEGKIEVAKELIMDRMSLEKISRMTRLSMEIVQKLAQEISRD
jgi:hypothetical protein